MFPRAHFERLLDSAARRTQRHYRSHRSFELGFVDAIKGKNVDLAQERLAKLGASSTVKHHSMLVKLLAAKGQLEEARAKLSGMAEAGVPPNAMSYTPVLDRLGKTGDLDAAFEVFSEMKAAGVTPNVWSYTALIGACRSSREPERGWSLWEEMIQAQHKRTPHRKLCTKPNSRVFFLLHHRRRGSLP